MKRVHAFLALAIALVSSAVVADGVNPGLRNGPVVTWDRIEGTIILPDESAMQVGPYFTSSLRFRIGGEGRVVLSLKSGRLHFQVKGLSWANHYDNGPLGAGLNGNYVATVVCDTTPGATATYQSADSPLIELVDGAGSFTGALALPQVCRDTPEKIVFLLRHDPALPNASLAGKFIAYGAGRVIR